jgi:ACS family glucarate transporter-like MFS transporter
MALDDPNSKLTLRSNAQRPTRTRYWVVVFAVTLAIILYIDRTLMSKAAPIVQEALGLNKKQMGSVFSAFLLAYALFEIPGGRLGDWLGPRKILLRVIIWWSLFTALTGLAGGLASLMVIQFMFGAGEAGCFPNLTKAFTLWLTKTERMRAQSIMWMSARWGGAFTPFLMWWVLSLVSWRVAFPMFGLLGVGWAVAFYLWFRDHPRDHPSVNAAELELLKGNEANLTRHGRMPWGRLVTSPSILFLWLQYVLVSYSWYFYITWLPTYLKETTKMPEMKAALLSGLPLFLGGIGCVLSGFVAGWLVRRSFSVTMVRRVLALVGFTGAAGMLLWSAFIPNPVLAMIAMGMAGFFNDLTIPGSWGTCMDIGGRFAGTVSGSMNMMGNIGGVLSAKVAGYLVDSSGGDWTNVIWISSAVYFLGGLCWLFIDSTTSLEAKLEEGKDRLAGPA